VIIAGLWLVWLGGAEAWRIVRHSPFAAAVTGIVLASSIIANRAWEAVYGPSLPPRGESLALALRESVKRIPGWIREQIGIFQYLDTPMPRFAYVVWLALVLLLLVAAAWVGTRRDRIALALGVGAALLVPVVLHALAMRPIGWAVQGRHVLPLTIVVPLLSGETLARRAQDVSARASAAASVLIGMVQLMAIYSSGRRSAVGTNGVWSFPFQAEWSPVHAWWPWLAVATLGGVILCCNSLLPRTASIQDSTSVTRRDGSRRGERRWW
jgi:hypothetical protein